MLRRCSTHSYSSSSLERPLRIDSDVEEEESCHVLNLLSSFSTLVVVGCDLEGKLIDRTWYLLDMAVVVALLSFLCFSETLELLWSSIFYVSPIYRRACIEREENIDKYHFIQCEEHVTPVWATLQVRFTCHIFGQHHLQ